MSLSGSYNEFFDSPPTSPRVVGDGASDFHLPASDDDSMKAIHQRKFMQLAYGIDLNVVKNEKQLENLLSLQEESMESLTAEEKQKCIGVTGTVGPSKRLTPAKWRRRVHALKYWKTGDGKFKTVKEFQAAYSDCKNLTYGARLQEVQENAEGIDLLYKMKLNKRTGVLEKFRVVHILETFDIIYEHHVSSSHHLSDTTKLKIDSAGFYNITRAEVEAFCDTCPTCNLKREGSKAQQGAKSHIQSGSFRWLWQLDLVDYREDPQIGHNGVTYKWLLNIKDHFTRFCILRPLPSKEAKHVAAELFFISNLLGYPMVIQTDNGNEFKGEVHLLVEELQQRDDKAIFLTTGQPRTPRHQGSVERSNGCIKKSIAKDVQHKRMLLEDPVEKKKISWLSEYPRSMASANSSLKTRRLYDVTPYFSLFGLPFKDPIFAHINSERFKRKCNVANRANLLGHDYKKRMALLQREGFHDGLDQSLDNCVDVGVNDDLDETSTIMNENVHAEAAENIFLKQETTTTNIADADFCGNDGDDQNDNKGGLFSYPGDQHDSKTKASEERSLPFSANSPSPANSAKVFVPPKITRKKPYKNEKSVLQKDILTLSPDDDDELDRKPKASEVTLVQFPKTEFCSAVSSPSSKPVTSTGNVKVKLEGEMNLLPPAKKPKEGEIYGDFIGSRSTKVSLGIAYSKAPTQLFRNSRSIGSSNYQFTLLELLCEKCNMCSGKQSEGAGAGQGITSFDGDVSDFHVHFPVGAGATRKVSLLDERYYQLCADSQRWLESDFVSSFAVLCSHYIHHPNKYVMVSGLNSKEKICKDQVVGKLKASVKYILCVANEGGHFAVLEIKLKTKQVTVYDGYNVTEDTCKKWTGHAINLLKRVNLVPLSASSLENFTINVNDSIFRQTDGSSCGPIACGVLWNLLSVGAFVPADYSQESLRKKIVQQYKYWIDLMEDQLFLIRTVGSKMAGFYREIDQLSKSHEKGNAKLAAPPNDKLTTPNEKAKAPSDALPEESPVCISPPLIKREPLDTSPTTNKMLEETNKKRLSIKENSDETARKRQKLQGAQMEKRYLDFAATIVIGNVVQVKVNPTERSRCNPLNILAIVFSKSSSGSSFCCVTEFGIIGYGTGKNQKHHWLSADKLILYKQTTG